MFNQFNGKLQNKIKSQPVTACIRNSGFSAKSKVSAFDKSQCKTESEMLFNPLLLIHAKRYARFQTIVTVKSKN